MSLTITAEEMARMRRRFPEVDRLLALAREELRGPADEEYLRNWMIAALMAEAPISFQEAAVAYDRAQARLTEEDRHGAEV